jgi:hypothetical protein
MSDILQADITLVGYYLIRVDITNEDIFVQVLHQSVIAIQIYK